MEEEYLKKIENLNMEYIDLKTSKEYKLGKDILETKRLLKKLQIFRIIMKLINRKKVNKFNSHGELENNFTPKDILKIEEKPRIAVYTCITGSYDKLITPFIKFDNIDYIAYTDNKEENNEVWQVHDIPENIKKIGDNVLINRYIKFHPNEFFDKSKYDYAIYLDGNIKIISDLTDFVYGINPKTGLALHRHRFRNCIYNEIEVCRLIKKGNYNKMKKQADRYESEGFPKNFGLYECNVIATDLNNDKSKKITDAWWEEFVNSESFRDQIALPYVVWKNNYRFDDIGSLGNNVYRNAKIRLKSHNS